jgi:hypothetical protein
VFDVQRGGRQVVIPLLASQYRITTAEGVDVIGSVQVTQGELSGMRGLGYLRSLERRARAGERLPIYEPEEGSILVFQSSTSWTGSPCIVPLAGASFELVN